MPTHADDRKVRPLLRFGLFGGLAALTLALAACTETADQTSTTEPAPVPTTPTTTTTLPPAPESLAQEVLSDPEFSARVTIEVTTRLRGGVVTETGFGTVAGSNSQELLVTDLSDLDRSYVTGPGRPLGIDGARFVATGERVVDGVSYAQTYDGRWRMVESTLGDTTIGHIFNVLAEVPEFEQIGSESAGGQQLLQLRPSAAVEYDLTAFSPDLDPTATFDPETELFVDTTGVPVIVKVRVGTEGALGGPIESEYTLRVSEVGAAPVVTAPEHVWRSVRSQGLEFYDDTPNLLDLDIPTSWTLVDHEPGVLQFETPEPSLVTLIETLTGADAGIDQVASDVLADLGMDAPIETIDLGVFPARFASTVRDDFGFTMTYIALQARSLALIGVWSGPAEDVEQQRAEFEQLLGTITWSIDMEDEPVPGETIADPTLQADTLALFDAAAGAVSVAGCETATVFWSELLGDTVDGQREPDAGDDIAAWVEEWYFDACGETLIFTILFSKDPSGGTNFSFDTDPRRPEQTPHREPLASPIDPATAATLLAEQPWFIEPGLDADEETIAAAVARARFFGGRLFVLVLADETDEEFAVASMERLGSGTLLIVGPETFSWISGGDIYTGAQLDAALEEALGATTEDKVIERFVSFLTDLR